MNCFYELETQDVDYQGKFRYYSTIDYSFNAHWHNSIEMIYVVRGMIEIGVNDIRRTMRAGSIALYGGGMIHYSTSLEPGTNLVICVLDPKFAFDYIQDKKLSVMFFDSQSMPEMGFTSEEADELRDRLNMLNREISLGQENSYDVCTNYVLLALGLLLRHINLDDKSPANTTPNGAMVIMQNAINYILDNFQADITLEKLADCLFISPFYLSRLFGRYTGMTFRGYLNHQRVLFATRLIATTDMPLGDIAQESGFSTLRTFNRVFKSICGITPSSYQKTHESKR